MNTDEYVIAAVVVLVVSVWMLSGVRRWWRMRGRLRMRENEEMKESVRQFNRRDHNQSGPWT